MSGMNCITQSTSIGSDKDAMKDPNSVFGKFLNALPDTTKPKEDAAKRKHEWWQAKANLSDLRKQYAPTDSKVTDAEREVEKAKTAFEHANAKVAPAYGNLHKILDSIPEAERVNVLNQTVVPGRTMLCYVVRPQKDDPFHPHVCDLDLIQKMTDWGTNLAIRTGTGKSAIVFAAEQMSDNKMEFTADEQVMMTKILQFLVYRLARTHVDVGKPHTFSHWALERPLSYFMLHRLGALTKPDRYESVVRFIGGFFHQGVIDSQGSNIVDALGDAFFCECRAMREKTEFDDIIDEEGNVVDGRRHLLGLAEGAIERFVDLDRRRVDDDAEAVLRRAVVAFDRVGAHRDGALEQGQRAVRQRHKVWIAAVADDQRAVARCVGPAGGERGLPGQRVRIVRCCGHQHDRQQAHLRGVG